MLWAATTLDLDADEEPAAHSDVEDQDYHDANLCPAREVAEPFAHGCAGTALATGRCGLALCGQNRNGGYHRRLGGGGHMSQACSRVLIANFGLLLWSRVCARLTTQP